MSILRNWFSLCLAAAVTCESQMVVGIDSGGSSTRVAAASDGGNRVFFRAGTVNAASGGDPAGIEGLAIQLRRYLDRLESPPRISVGLATAGWGGGPIEPLADPWHRALSAGRADVRIYVTNDATPLVYGANGYQAGLVLGTGSAFVGRAPGAVGLVRVGGSEYIASDEGGAVDIGRAALVAAVRAEDGRGPQTSLVGDIEHEFGMAVVAVARELAVNAWPKLGLARIAPIVTRAWDRGDDDVSAAILRRCLADVEMAVSTLIERMGARENVAWAVTGGLLTHCRVYREGIVGALHDIGRASTVEVLPDVAERVLTLVENGDRDFVGSCVMYP